MDGHAHPLDERSALLPWVECAVPVPPQPKPTDGPTLEDRVRGMLMGVAVGDSLGNTSEGLSPQERRRCHGEIRDYLPHPREDMRRIGFPSDDTQMTFWTVDSIVRLGRLEPADVAAAFVGPRIFGVGRTVTEFLLAYRFERLPWYQAGRASAGNGALMRIAPVVLPHLRSMSEALWRDVVAATVVTHRDEAAVASSVGFVGLLVECLARGKEEAPAAEWWVTTFLRYARAVESLRETYGSRKPGDTFQGTLCDRVEGVVPQAIREGRPVVDAAETWYSGAYLLETVPCVLYILARHGHDPEEAIIRAVNDTRDNDTVAAIVGAAVGALHGVGSLPDRWMDAHLGRTVEDDDGRVQTLVDAAVRMFLP